jgi:hypothetical protein
MNKKYFSCLIFSLSLFCGVFAQEARKDSVKNNIAKPVRSYTTTRLTTAKPVIDGVLNDDCWKTGEWSGDFTQLLPNEGAKPTQDTKIKLLYDDKNIYVAIRAFDTEPSKISRKLGRRDELYGDIAGINFDSYHDHRTGFEFSVTAAGQKIDLILFNPMAWDMNWNAVWYVKTGLEDSAWVAEYEIPLSQLRYSSDKEQVWGMHVWRWIDRISEESDWEVQSMSGPGMLYAFGELKGIKDIPKSRRIEIMPYAVGKLKTFEKVEGNPFADKGRSWLGNFGLDAKIGLTSNFTADLTVNPDFGQVESDPSVMNLTAFETFYEEKRPFFLEGLNIFKFEMGDANLFYTRRIGGVPEYKPDPSEYEYMKYPDNTSILSAVKISGKTSDGLAVGVMQSLTANENAQLFSNGETKDLRVEPLTSFTVGRVQQDYKEGNSTLGGIFTATNRFINDPYLEGLNRNAFTGGIDFLTQWKEKKYFLDAKFIGSSISGSTDAISNLQLSSARYYQRPDANHVEFDPTRTQLIGQGGHIKIGKGTGLFRYSEDINWKSPGLELNDVGFMQMADQLEQETEISYFVNQPVSVFRTYTVGIHQQNNWDYALNYLNSGLFLTGSMEFLNRWKVAPSVFFRNESLNTRLLRGGNAIILPAMMESTLSINSDVSKKIFASLSGSYTAAQEDNFRNSIMQASMTVIPFNVLKLSAGVYYANNMDELQYVETKSLNGSNKYIMGLINQNTLGATFRVDYYITPELSLQYYGSPFASVGKYSELKEITDSKADKYSDRFSLLNTTFSEADNSYNVAANGDEPAYSIANPDFTFSQFRSNLVFRWEYRPGSQLYFVWANERTSQKNGTHSSVNEAMGNLGDAFPNNIFQIKLSYWFSL